MELEEQLSWEKRVGRIVAVAAFLSAGLLVATLVYGNSFAETPPTGQDADTVFAFGQAVEHRGQLITQQILQSISTALLAAPLWFLAVAAAYRREQTHTAAKWLGIIGPVASGVVGIFVQIAQLNAIDKAFAKLQDHSLPPKVANDFLKDEVTNGFSPVLQGLAIAVTLALAFALVMVALNAMRAGLLSRFMGILGIITGALLVLPLGQFSVVQLFWTAAIGILLLDRWPQGGRGPAWASGEPDPWPTARDRAEEMAAQRAARADEREEEPERLRSAIGGGRRARGGTAVDELDDDRDANGNGAQPARRQSPQHPRSKKRKRKRR